MKTFNNIKKAHKSAKHIARLFMYLFLIIAALQLSAQFSDKPTYTIFSGDKQVSYQELVTSVLDADIVFFGEYHNNPIHHWLQYELLRDMHSFQENVIIGAEMFETDVQILIDEYMSGLIRERNFRDEARVWQNYQTDYRPLIEFAKDNKLRFVATNVPRRYASLVNHLGVEQLQNVSEQALQYLPPLPFPFDKELPGYANMMNMSHGALPGASENIAMAQALKDATMAWNILKNFKNGFLFFHINGAYHSDNREGIVWYIDYYAKQLFPEQKFTILTISGTEAENLLKKPDTNKADFIIVTPDTMTKTY